MFGKILNTFFTRVLTAILMFLVVIINTNTFGAEGTGTIALVILGLTLLQVLSNFVGGSTLVYLTPQKNNFQILFLSYIWSLVSNVAGVFVFDALHLIPHEYVWHLMGLTLVYSVFYIHISIMQGKEDIKLYNCYQLTQVLLLILSLSGAIAYHKMQGLSTDITLYLYAFLFSYLVPALCSCIYIAKRIGRPTFTGMGALLKEMFQLGFWTQLANLTQLLTYRLNYYLIGGYLGRKPLGIYELGSKLSEAVWIFPKSMCLIQYARIANNQEKEYTKNLTLSMFKVVLLFSLIAILVLLLLPASFIAWIFGPDFINSKPVICSLLPGIVFLACNSILSHYFAGYGKYWINAIGSIIGLVVTAALGFLLIPKASSISTMLALQIAGWISSAAYFASMIYTLICFLKQTTARLSDFLLTSADIRFAKEVIAEKLQTLKARKQ